jgi:hypothetical protein
MRRLPVHAGRRIRRGLPFTGTPPILRQCCHGAVRRQALSSLEADGRPQAKRELPDAQTKAIVNPRAEPFDFHGGHRANASRRSATGAVCSPNPAALRARSAGIPVKNEVITGKSSGESRCPPANPGKARTRERPEAFTGWSPQPQWAVSLRQRAATVSARATGRPPLTGKGFFQRCQAAFLRSGRRAKEAAPADRGVAHGMWRINRE